MLLVSNSCPPQGTFLIEHHLDPKYNSFLKKLVRFHMLTLEHHKTSPILKDFISGILKNDLFARILPANNYYKYYDHVSPVSNTFYYHGPYKRHKKEIISTDEQPG